MSARHKDALFAQAGACNELAVANALVRAIREAREAGVNAREDDAVRLIAHQLGFLLSLSALDSFSAYGEAVERVKAAAA